MVRTRGKGIAPKTGGFSSEAYRSAPEATRRRIYLETMNEILPQVRRKIIVDNSLKGILPLLNLDAGARAQERGTK